MTAALEPWPLEQDPWEDDLEPVGPVLRNAVVPLDGSAVVVRKVTLTAASTLKVRPVRWFWKDRIPLGSLALLPGREGIGKSTLAYALAADTTRGRLEGAYFGEPRAVLVVATEDSWEHTILPRLMAADADLERIYRVDVATDMGADVLVLPRDLMEMERVAKESGTALILLDPLMSRLASNIDSHKDADVRRALEPLVALADRCGASVLGLIHVNKGSGTDPLNLVMGSRAFTAVARAVLFVMVDPDDENLRMVGQAKNNLGRTDLPTKVFRIASTLVATTEEGEVWTGRVEWIADTDRTIRDALEAGGEGSDGRSAVQEAGEWLTDYLTSQGGSAPSIDCKKTGKVAGHSEDALKRSRGRCKIATTSHGFPRVTSWVLADTQEAAPSLQLEQSEQSEHPPVSLAPTAPTAPTGSTSRTLTLVEDREPLVCRVCAGPLDPVLVDDGEHPGCSVLTDPQAP